LLLYVASRPLVDLIINRQVWAISIGQLWSVGLVLVAAWCLVNYADRIDSRRAALPLSFVAAYAVLAMSRGDRHFGLVFGLRLATWVLVLLAVAAVATTIEGQNAIVSAGLATAAVTAAAILVAIKTNQYGSAYYDYTLGQTTQRPSGFASLAVFSIVFALISLHGRRRLLAAVLAAVLSVEVILSYTRTAYVALAIVFATWLLAGIRGRRGWPVAAALAATAVVIGVVYSAREQVGRRFADFGSAGQGIVTAKTGSGRIGFWNATLEGTLSSGWNALFGRGAGASVAFIHERLVVNAGIWAHNDFLELFASGGIALAVLYVLFVVWLGRPARQILRSPLSGPTERQVAFLTLGALAAFVAISVLSGIIFSTDESLVFALLIGLTQGLAERPGVTCFGQSTVRAEPRRTRAVSVELGR